MNYGKCIHLYNYHSSWSNIPHLKLVTICSINKHAVCWGTETCGSVLKFYISVYVDTVGI